MSAGGWAMSVVMLFAVGALLWLIGAMARSIRNERTTGRSIWREFSLGLSLLILFLATWLGQAISEWQVFTDEQRTSGRTPSVGDFVGQFAQSTLENWQSEFLQLFAFVSLTALYIHKGSAESKDGEERIEASLRRIEEHLGTLPPSASSGAAAWQLPNTPLDAADAGS